MECEHVKENLSAFLDHELPEQVQAQIREHLQECAECLSEKNRLTETIFLTSNMEIPQISGHVYNNVLANIKHIDAEKSFSVFTYMLTFFGVLTFMLLFGLLVSPFGIIILTVFKAIGRNLVDLTSLAFIIVSRFTENGAIVTSLFLGFLLSVWLLKKVVINNDLRGPVHE